MPYRPKNKGKKPYDPRPFTAAGVAAQIAAGISKRPRSAPLDTKHVFFCDETGNSGSRFYIPDQPIYAEGGWIIPHDERSQVESELLRLEQRHGYTPRTKGTSLKSSPRGRSYMLEAFEVLRHHAAPFVYLIEKRYFVCSKAVESYFDPTYNSAIGPQETWDPDVRQARAEMFYAGPEELVALFAEAYRTEDGPQIAAVGGQWVEWFKGQGDMKFASELNACLPTIGEHMREELRVCTPQTHLADTTA